LDLARIYNRSAAGFFYRTTINLLSAGFLFGVVGLFVVFFGLWFYGRDLPDYQKLADYEPPIVSRVYAADGHLIGEFASEKRIFVPYATIPKRVVNAFIAAEDQRFFSHPGIDIFGIARAAYANFLGGAKKQGGSTITQQVAKNFFLSSKRDYERKIKEMILSFRIERAYTKDRILELYLNQIDLGRQSFGVAAAAQAYFGKSLDELTVAEAAFLAVLPKAPSLLSRSANEGLAKSRRAYVIQRMLEDGYISKAEADEAKAAPLGVKPPPPYISLGAEYFVEEVRREMLAKHGEDKMKAGGFVIRSTLDPKLQAFADAALRRGLVAYDKRHGWRGAVANLKDGQGERWADGWRQKLRKVQAPAGHGDWPLAFVLEIDDKGADIGMADGRRGRIPLTELTWARKQGEIVVEQGKPAFKTATGPQIKKATDVLKQGDVVLVERISVDSQNKPVPSDTYTLRQVPEVTGSLVAMDPHTGRVVAMSGGFSFWLSQFNNVTQAWRQPGSSFKPYVYLAALQEGFTPSTIILDAPIVVKFGDKTYRPRNASGKFYGPTPLRTGIEQSRNLMTVRLAEATGLEKVVDLVGKLGVSDKLEPVMAMALGAYETTAMRHVTAYSMIVNGGRKITPTLVDRIQDRYGRTIYRHDDRKCDKCSQVAFSGQTMPELPTGREQVVDEDNAFQMVNMMQGVVQRGTATIVAALGRPVAGKTGTTNDVLDAWFVGFTPDLAVSVWVGFDKPRTLGPQEQGGVTAAPIFLDFMKSATKDMPPRNFTQPRGVVAVRAGAGYEYYKRGTEPGTGKGRTVDTDTAEDPSATPGNRPRTDVGRSTGDTY
jgi:penicillin-binding protein 1A